MNDQAAARVAGAQAAAVAAALRQPTAAFKTLPWPIRRDPRYDAAGALQLARYNPIYYVPLATGDDGVVVRLDRDGEYGLAAHQAWADLGLAPKVGVSVAVLWSVHCLGLCGPGWAAWPMCAAARLLLFAFCWLSHHAPPAQDTHRSRVLHVQVLRVESLPGGWHLVEMEWLPLPYEWQQLSMLRGTELDKALAVVQKQLAFAHSATGMVHGDMRPRNCLVRRDGKGSGSWQVRFIDFEWAGREGEATYPAGLNPEIPWPDDVAGGKQLRCAHDIELLATCAASLLAGDGQRPRGRGVVRSSLCSAARDRCTVPVRKAADVVLQRGVAVGWRQRAAAGWSRPAALGRRLAW